MLYLYGSKALAYWNCNIKTNGSDYDVIYDYEWELELFKHFGERIKSKHGFSIRGEFNFEFTPADFLYCGEVCRRYAAEPFLYRLPNVDHAPIRLSIVSPLGLMLFKRSHLHRPIKFPKHIRDYHLLRKMVGGDVDHEWQELLKRRTTATKQEFGDRTPRLGMSNDNFFDNNVVCPIVHDDIHYATCFYERPLYEELKHDSSKAYCAKDLWLNLSDEDKTKCVQEECQSIALERKIIPSRINGRQMPSRIAYEYAVTRVCTTLCSGFFREWAIDHWPEVIDNDMSFVDRFFESDVWNEYSNPMNKENP